DFDGPRTCLRPFGIGGESATNPLRVGSRFKPADANYGEVLIAFGKLSVAPTSRGWRARAIDELEQRGQRFLGPQLELFVAAIVDEALILLVGHAEPVQVASLDEFEPRAVLAHRGAAP